MQFSSVLDAFRPYDSVFAVEGPSEITDSALTAPPVLKSRATSVDRPPLNKIAEDEAEGERDLGRPDANDSSTQASSSNVTEEEAKSSTETTTITSSESGATKPPPSHLQPQPQQKQQQQLRPLPRQHPSSSSLSVKSAMPDVSRRKYSFWNSLYTKYREHGQKHQHDTFDSSLRSSTPDTMKRPSSSRLSIISAPDRWRSTFSRRSVSSRASSRSSHVEDPPTPDFNVYRKPHAHPHVETQKSSLTPGLRVEVAASRPKTALSDSRNGGRSVSLPLGLRSARVKNTTVQNSPSAEDRPMTGAQHGNGNGGNNDNDIGQESLAAPNTLPPLPVTDLLARHRSSKNRVHSPAPPDTSEHTTNSSTPNSTNASTSNDNNNNDQNNEPTIMIHHPPYDDAPGSNTSTITSMSANIHPEKQRLLKALHNRRKLQQLQQLQQQQQHEHGHGHVIEHVIEHQHQQRHEESMKQVTV